MAVVRLTVAFLMASLATATAQQPVPGDAARGKDVATNFCRGCHLVSREDRGPVSDGVPSFMEVAARPGQTAASVAAVITSKHPVMPTSPITRQQAADVAAYILSLNP